jgi:hypothetical protein
VIGKWTESPEVFEMLRTVEAIIDEKGHVDLVEPIALARKSRALLTILDLHTEDEAALLSEAALADWNRPEEDEAWAHLKLLPSL